MRFFLLLLVILTSSVAYAKDEISPEISTGIDNKAAVTSEDFMVVSANPYASDTGREIIQKGGNAIDAAIAMQMVLNVVEPQSSGIGGGGFLLYFDKENHDIVSLDGRETAPKKANERMFLDKEGKPIEFFEAIKGGLSVGTPGLLKMLKKAHDKYGKLPWADLFAPAIKIAENGFPISPRLFQTISSESRLAEFPEPAHLFYDDTGKVRKQGDTLRNKKLADTFRQIAANGIDDFYNGKIASDIVEAVRASPINPGLLSIDDFKNYEVKERIPVCSKYRTYLVCGMGPPSSGGITILETLGILENFDLAKFSSPLSVEVVNLVTEATKLAFADRNSFLSDTDFVKAPIDQLLSKKYLKKRSKLISADKTSDTQVPGIEGNKVISDYNYEAPSTTHISVIDKQGNAVSMTTSIEHAFGSGLMTDGFMLNNQLTDFSFVPEIDGKKVANRVEPGKRPRSSMSPTLVFDKNDKLIMVIGSPGGARIIPYVLKTIIAVLDFNMDIQSAINLPHYLNMNSVLELEKDKFPSDVQKQLESMGHQIIARDLNSGLHAIVRTNNLLTGAADQRREGLAVGK